jgi:aryl-alcohol dehydrogenase-like predicted oxidoreductase
VAAVGDFSRFDDPDKLVAYVGPNPRGPPVRQLRLGCMVLSANYGEPVDEAAGIAPIRAVVDRDVTFFDTAKAHGPFTNEELVGKALAPVRDQVAVPTKSTTWSAWRPVVPTLAERYQMIASTASGPGQPRRLRATHRRNQQVRVIRRARSAGRKSRAGWRGRR